MWLFWRVSVQGLRPSKDPAFAIFEGEFLLTSSAAVKCDGLVFGAFPGCVTRCFTLTSRFLPQARESDDLRQAMSPFSLFLSSFSGAQRILGCVRPRRIVAVRPPKTGKRRLHLEEPSDWDSLRAALWHNLLSNTPLKNADSESRHSVCIVLLHWADTCSSL